MRITPQSGTLPVKTAALPCVPAGRRKALGVIQSIRTVIGRRVELVDAGEQAGSGQLPFAREIHGGGTFPGNTRPGYIGSTTSA